jgi:WD40 repeat protein
VEVSAAAFSPDNKILITGYSPRMFMGGDGPKPPFLRLWDVDSGKPLGDLKGHDRGITGITGVAFLPDGKRAVSASRDGTLKLWDVAKRTIIRTLESKDDAPSCIAVSLDGARALSGGIRGGLKLWDLAGGKLIRSFGTLPPGIVLAVAFSPDGRRALLGRVPAAHWDPRKGAACVLDLSDGRVIQWLSQDDGWSNATATFSPDGSLLAAIRMSGKEPADWRYSLVILDATSGKIVREFEKRATPAWALGFVPQGPPWHILSADADFHITLWDDATGRQIWSVPTDLFFVAFSPDRTLAVSAQGGDPFDIRTGDVSPGAKLKIWDTAHGKLFRTLQDPDADRQREILEMERARRERAGKQQ